MSERRIFETFRSELKESPSYRELRSVWKDTGARHGRIGRAKGARLESDGKLNTKATSEYGVRIRETRRQAKEGIIPANRPEKLDRNFAIGYLGIQATPPEAFSNARYEEYFRNPTADGY